MKKLIVAVIVIALVIGAGYWIFSGDDAQVDSTENVDTVEADEASDETSMTTDENADGAVMGETSSTTVEVEVEAAAE